MHSQMYNMDDMRLAQLTFLAPESEISGLAETLFLWV